MSLLKRIEKAQQPVAQTSRLEELRQRRPGSASPKDTYRELKNRIQERLIAELDPRADMADTAELRRTIEEMFQALLAEENIVLSRSQRQELFEQIVAEILGYGPIQPLLADDTVTEIMVNGPKQVYVERFGKLEKTDITFDDEEHLLRIIDRIVSPLGRRIDESSPMVDARLPDGSSRPSPWSAPR